MPGPGFAAAGAVTHTGGVEPDTPDLQHATPRSPGLFAAAGGALVVILVGGIIGGVLATQQPPAYTPLR